MSAVFNPTKRIFITFSLIVLLLLTSILIFSTAQTEKAYADPIAGFIVSDAVIDSGQAEFTIEREDTTTAESIDYRTISGTAVAGIHFTATSGTLDFAVGEDQKIVSVTVTNANTQYDTYAATQYTNIDRIFYLQIYNASEGAEISISKATATLTKDSDYQVDAYFFNIEQTFYSFSGSYNINEYSFFVDAVNSPGEYYKNVASNYAYKIDINVPDDASQSIVVGFNAFESSNYPTFYPDGELISVGDSDYLIKMYSTLAAYNYSLPYLSVQGDIVSDNAAIGSSGIIAEYQAIFNSTVIIENEYIGLPADDCKIFAMSSNGADTYTIGSIDVKGKVIDTQSPELLTTSYVDSAHTGDSVCISLVFDEIIDQSDLATSYLTTNNSGNFNYLYGAGSNVLVFEGTLGSEVVDQITISGINGTIQDFSGNEISWSNISMDIMNEDITPTWQDDGIVGSSFAGGDGSSNSPYQIATGQQLAYLAKLVNEANDDYNDKNYILTADIDLSIEVFPALALEEDKILWIAIGNDDGTFNGVFDGDGYEITGISFDLSKDIQTYYGLFGKTSGAVIKNIGLTNTQIIGEALDACYIGGLVAYAQNTDFVNVYIDGFKSVVKMNGGNLGVMLGYSNDIVLENFYIMNYIPTFYEGSIYDYFNIICAEGTYELHIGYVNTQAHYSNMDTVPNIDLSTVHENLYDYAIDRCAFELKKGRDLRLYKWVAGGSGYPVLQKVNLLPQITLNMSASERNLGQNIVKTFDEAIVGLAPDGVIVIDEEYTINNLENWKLPQAVFNDAYITSVDTFVGDAVVLVNKNFSLEYIKIVNNTDSAAFFQNSQENFIRIYKGTVISGYSLINNGLMVIEDDDIDTISLGKLYAGASSMIGLQSPLYAELSIELDPNYIDTSFSDLIIAAPENDAGLYLDKVSLVGLTAFNYALIAESNSIRVYEKLSWVYFDYINGEEDGTGAANDPVNNLQKALEITYDSGIIYIVSTVSITENTTWDLFGYDITLSRDSVTPFVIQSNATLTLKNVNINSLNDTAVIINDDAELILDNVNIETDHPAVYTIIVEERAYLEISNSEVEGYICLNGDIVFSKVTFDGAITNDFHIYVPEEFGENNVIAEFKESGLDMADYQEKIILYSPSDYYYIVLDEENNTLNAQSYKYNVTFYLTNGGDVYDEQVVNKDALVEQPTNPFRLGYEFLGWKDVATSLEYNFETAVLEDIELYADWKNYFIDNDALGTEESPLLISTYEHLQNLSYLFSADSDCYDEYKDKYYKLNNNIDIGEEDDSFIPIGAFDEELGLMFNHFEGFLDGNGYIINNLKIQTNSFASLMLVNQGTITSLGISGQIEGPMVAASFAIANEGTITKCINFADIVSAGMAAGIALMNFDVYNYMDADGEFNQPELYNHGTISDCYNFGNIYAEEGGAGISAMHGYIYNCFNIGFASVAPITYGALEVENCFYPIDGYSEIPEFLGTAIRLINMLGENTEEHTNILYNSLYSEENNLWVLNNNEGNVWHLPNLIIFEGKGNTSIYGNIYHITFEFNDDGVTPNQYDVQVEGMPIFEPQPPQRDDMLLYGWYFVEDGVMTDTRFYFNEGISGDTVLRATWGTYRLIIEGDTVTGIEIASAIESVSIEIPNFIIQIAEKAFENQSQIVEIVFEENSSLDSIGSDAFKGTGINAITIPATVSNIDAQSFFGAALDSVNVTGEGQYYAIDGVLYKNDGENVRLVYYPYAKTDTEYILPAGVNEIGQYAFIGEYEIIDAGEEEQTYYYGNPYIESLTLNDNLDFVEEKGLYGLSALEKVIITNEEPSFEANTDAFRYFNGEQDTINANLIIQTISYVAYENYSSFGYWNALKQYYIYPITITFNYQDATGNNTEVERTRVNGEEEGELIFNGTPIGTLPQPYRFGYDFVGWITGDSETVTSLSSFEMDTEIYAIWIEWQEVDIGYDEISDKLTVNDIVYETTINQIIAENYIIEVNFNNVYTEELIELNYKTITFNGTLNTTSSIVLITNNEITCNLTITMQGSWPLFTILGGETSSPNTLYYGGYTFIQSETCDVEVYNDRVKAILTSQEYNILCWDNKEDGLIGRNTAEMLFSQLPEGEEYSPIEKYTLTIIDTTIDYDYDNREFGVTYYTNRDVELGIKTCEVEYYTNEADRDSRQNALLGSPKYAGTYYYIIYRKGYDDVCDAEDVKGSYIIHKAEVTVEVIETASITKVFDGNKIYTGTLIKDVHYTVTGIVDEEAVEIIETIIYNDMNVDVASYATVTIAISDTDNYSINESFEIDATITLRQVNVIWDYQAEYVYDATDQGQTVLAKYLDINENEIELTVNFSGAGTEFVNAGEYIAIAINTDTNYTLAEESESISLTIDKATVIVQAIEEITIYKTYDGNDIYNGELVLDEHYSVSGILDSVSISITSKTFNSPNVDTANAVTVTVTISDNYTINDNFEIPAYINPREVDVNWTYSDEYIYNGSDQSNSIQAYFKRVDDETNYYGNIVFSAADTEFTEFKNAGEYTATASFDDNNYSFENNTMAIRIKPKSVNVIWTNEGSYIYTAESQASTVSAKYLDINENNVELEVEFTINDDLSEFVNAGEYIATAINTDTNYTLDEESESISLTIDKAAGIITAQSVQNHTYDGDIKNVVATLNHSETTLNYSPLQSYTEAGEYEITVTANETANYYGAEITIELNIDKAQSIITAESVQNHTYDGDIKNVVATLNHSETTLLYSPQQGYTEAGEYEITVTANETANYYGAEITIELNIDKAQSIITAESIQIHTFDGNIKDVVATLNHSQTTLHYSPQQGYAAAGNYTITVTANETTNYYGAEISVELKINKAGYEEISHNDIYTVYEQNMTLADVALDNHFYWVNDTIELFAGEGQSFAAYYNEDSENFANYYLNITVNVDKAIPEINNLPQSQPLVAGRELSISSLLGGSANVDGAFEWDDGSEIIFESGTYQRPVRFVPTENSNYYEITADIEIEIYYLEVTFISYNFEETSYVCYNGQITYEHFPQPADKAGYSKAWEIDYDLTNIVEDIEVNAVYNLLDPQVSIIGYDGAVYYGETVTIQVSIAEMQGVVFYYDWYFNDNHRSTSNCLDITDVAQSGTYKVVVEATDGEQTTSAQAEIEVVINKAQATIEADEVQEHIYDGNVKYVDATLDHSETELVYTEQRGYIDSNELGYSITISATETANYLAVSKEVTLIIHKANIVMTNITFEDASFVYDKQLHSIEISGELPSEILSVNYIDNELIYAGSKTAIAMFIFDETNYNTLEPMQAVITIVPRDVFIVIDDKTSVYGQPLETLTCQVTNTIAGDNLHLSLSKAGNNGAGVYDITATIDNLNYNPIYTNGTYTIIKAVIDMENISFNNLTVVYNAQKQSIVLSGVLPSEIQDVVYTNNSATNAGIYAATASFVYDEDNYEEISDMQATLTISRAKITATFHPLENVYYDGNEKEILVTFNGVPSAENEDILPIITYNKTVVEPDYYTATVSVDNDNYELIGDKTFEFIVYLKEIRHEREQDVDVVAILPKGFLPQTTISVLNVSGREVIENSELFKGKEKKQTFDIVINGNELGANDYITMKLLIDEEFRYLDNLKVAKVDAQGNIHEMECIREGNYLKFDITDTEGKYIIIGEGKGNVYWIIAAIAGGAAVVILVIVVIVIIAKKKKKLRMQVIGK